MTPQEIITQARVLISDDHASLPARFSDAVLLGFVNQLMKRVLIMRPDLFIFRGTITPTDSQVEQVLPSNAVRLLELNRVTSGGAIREVHKETLDRNYPTWTTETAGTPVNWMRHPRNPTAYFLSPAPGVGVTLQGEYVDSPATLLIGDTIPLADAYFSALVDGVVFLAESVDVEHVGTGRARFYYDSFAEAFATDFQQRALVDDERGQVGNRVTRRRGSTQESEG